MDTLRVRVGVPADRRGLNGRRGLKVKVRSRATGVGQDQAHCFDKSAVCGGVEVDANAEQDVKGIDGITATVPSEHELVEVAAQMQPPQPVEGAEHSALEIGEHAVSPFSTTWAALLTNDLRDRGRGPAGQHGHSSRPSVVRRAPGAATLVAKGWRLPAEKSSTGASRMRRGSPSGPSSTAPATNTSYPPGCAAPMTTGGRSSLIRNGMAVSSASTKSSSGPRSDDTMTRRACALRCSAPCRTGAIPGRLLVQSATAGRRSCMGILLQAVCSTPTASETSTLTSRSVSHFCLNQDIDTIDFVQTHVRHGPSGQWERRVKPFRGHAAKGQLETHNGSAGCAE